MAPIQPTRIALSGLIVIVVVLLIGAVAFPLFSTARTDGHRLRGACLSNLKQLGIATSMYGSDFDGEMPPHAIWMDALEAYTKNSNLFHCTAVGSVDSYGYAFNIGVKSTGDNIAYQATTPLIYDSMNLKRNACDAFGSLPSPPRHEGANNVVFADAHSKTIRY